MSSIPRTADHFAIDLSDVPFADHSLRSPRRRRLPIPLPLLVLVLPIPSSVCWDEIKSVIAFTMSERSAPFALDFCSDDEFDDNDATLLPAAVVEDEAVAVVDGASNDWCDADDND